MDESGQKFAELYEKTSVLVAVYDSFDRLRYANAAFRETFFLEPGETPLWGDLMRRNLLAGRGTVIRDPNFDAWLIATQSRRGKVGFRAFETDLVGGRWLWMTETVQEDGWMLCIASDITHLRADDRAVRQDRDFAIKASYTDELTGVSNRRFVTARIDEMLQQPLPANGVYGCVVVIDLDNFKFINDRYGHQIGDTVLRDFARRIQDQVRRTDCFGRVGGEEFMLVLPATPIEQACLLVERMLAIIRISSPLPERPEIRYTFSAGIAAGRASDTASDVYMRADKALYAAKVTGRNRIELEELESGSAALAQ